MAASDFLFSIGADSAAADEAVQAFVKRTNAAVDGLHKANIASNAGMQQAIKNQAALLQTAEKRLVVEEKIAAAQRKNASAGNSSNGGGGLTDISATASRNAMAVGKQKDAMDMLGRIVGNTMFKFIEYEVVMKAFNGAIGEVMNSLNEASNVQMEMVLQRIYNAQINTNDALKDAIVIAKQWGSDITDVQQAIGLWTKQTSQMHDATGKLVDSQTALAAAAKLAADAEKFHRASGVDSLEVYTKSISMWHELGISLGEIPAMYDKIAYAATKIARPLKAQPGKSGGEEGIKDIFDAVAESGATLKAQGMDESTIIATVAQQIENLGTQGSRAGTLISTMFGSLNQGGKPLKAWVTALGGEGAFKDADTFMEAAIQHVDQLKKAQVDGALHVKPNTMNTWRAFIETLEQVKQKADDIRKNSGKGGGMLEQISEAEMNTYNGQVARLGASFQELNLALGTQLLPTATRFVSFLSGSLLPMLAANSAGLARLAQSGIELGAAYLVMLGISKVTGALATFRGEAASASLVAREFGAAELATVPGMEAAMAQMNLEIAALERLKQEMAVVEWQTGGLQAACEKLGITEGELATITETRLVAGFKGAGEAALSFGAKIAETMGPLLKVYAVIEAVTGAMAAFDQESNLQNVMNTKLEQQRGGWAEWGDKLNPLHFGSNVQNIVSSFNGGDKRAQTQFDNLAHGDPELEKLYNEFKSSHDDANKAALQQEILLRAGQDYTQKHFQNVPGYPNIDKIPKWLQDIMNRANGGTPADRTPQDPLGGGGHKSKEATEQQIAAESVNKDKADAMAQISQWRDKANAADQLAKSILKVGEASGFTQDIVKKLAAAFKTQNDAIFNGQSATQKEIASLDAQKEHLEALIKTHHASIDSSGNVHGGDRSAAVYAEAKAWRMADEAITKAKGNLALYNTQKAKLQQTQSTTMAEANAWAALSQGIPKSIAGVHSMSMSFLGYNDVKGSGSSSAPALSSPQAFQSYISGLDDSLSHVTTTMGKLATAGSQVSTLKQMGASIYELYEKLKSSDPKQAAVFAQMLIEINKAGLKADQGLDEANKGVDEFQKNMSGLIGSLASKNSEDMGKLLGLDSGTVEAQKTLIDGYNSINDSVEKIDGWVKSTAGSYNGLNDSQKQMVQSAIQYLNVQQQILPLLAQQEQIQNSIAYKATQETLQKQGEEVLDQAIARLMGNQNNAQTREAAYKNAISGTALSGMQSLFKDYLTNTVTQWWSQTVKQMTNSMFGDPADKARNLEASMLKTNRDGLTTILQDTKTQVVDKLITWEQKFAGDVQKFVGAGSGSGSGSGGSGGGTQGANGQAANAGSKGNPIAVTPVDATSGMQMGDATTPMQVTDAQMTASAEKAGASVTSALGNDKSDNSYGADAANSPLTQSGFSLISGLLGPLGAALGPLLQKLENTKGGQVAGNIIGGAAQGYAIGGMEQTSAGNSSDWGAVGGALGAAASMIPGIGPILGAILPTAGGFLGGLFGNHETAADEPDVYDTANYGQFVSNMNGTVGTYNGQTIAAQPQYNISDGAMSMGQQMWAWAQKNPQDPLAKQIQALGPKLGIVNEYQGVFTLGSGKTISVTQYEQLGQEWQAKASGQTNSPIVSVNSYGGGSAAGAYGTPGMDSSTFLSEEQGWASGLSGSTGYGSYNAPVTGGGSQGGGGGMGDNAIIGGVTGSSVGETQLAPTATPGYGGSSNYGVASGASITALQLQISTPVYLDGKLITQIVNAYNAQSRSNKGGVGAPAL